MIKHFEKIAIWGLGLMGGSLAAALKTRGFSGIIAGISSPGTVGMALDSGFVDAGYSHGEYRMGIEGADLVVLASPINTIMENLTLLGTVVDEGTVITDVGSTKSAIMHHACQVLPEGVGFIGGHPMTGSEESGIEAADPCIYENALWVLTPGREARSLEPLTGLIEMLGSKVVLSDPLTHDLITARISHMPQIVAVTLMNAVGDWNEEDDLTLRLAAGGFRDMTRIAASPFEMWSDILATNRKAVLQALDTFIDDLKRTRDLVEGGALRPLFERAARLRLSVPRNTRGFAMPLQDVMVLVQDEPGVLSRISTCLAENAINIRDIEVLKVRLGDGGTMRLAFGTADEADSAVRLLTGEGFRSWIKE